MQRYMLPTNVKASPSVFSEVPDSVATALVFNKPEAPGTPDSPPDSHVYVDSDDDVIMTGKDRKRRSSGVVITDEI